MSQDLTVLLITAASIAFFHTILGPDHYLPFIVLSRARKWSMVKTWWVTFLCGLGHVGSSVVIGAAGAVLGVAVGKLEFMEGIRGSFAAWVLIAFGLAYFLWGLRAAWRGKGHCHPHVHMDGVTHLHAHDHLGAHGHVHGQDGQDEKINMTPWILFIVFVLGPCEPLIPLLMYPALEMGTAQVALVAGVFSVVTILTMLTVVTLASYGIRFIPLRGMEKYAHALAGAAIALSGLAVALLGL